MLAVCRNLSLAAVAVASSACAASPESIRPNNISTVPYAKLSCAQMAAYKVTLTGAYNEAADSENSARTMDAAIHVG